MSNLKLLWWPSAIWSPHCPCLPPFRASCTLHQSFIFDLKVDKARCHVKNIIPSLILIDWARMVDRMLLRPRWWGVWLDRRADVAVWQPRKHEAGWPRILVLCPRPGPCWSIGRSVGCTVQELGRACSTRFGFFYYQFCFQGSLYKLSLKLLLCSSM